MTQKLHAYFHVFLILKLTIRNKWMVNIVFFSKTIKSIIDNVLELIRENFIQPFHFRNQKILAK